LHYKYNNHDKRVIKTVKLVHINKNLLQHRKRKYYKKYKKE